MHAFLSPDLTTVEQIANIKRPTDQTLNCDDKKIKKICDVNSDPSRTTENVNGEVPEANSSSLRLPVCNQSFNIVDVKPEKMEDLSGYHISSSKGSIRLIDLALCDSHSKLFEEPDAAGSKLFFTEIIASVSDIKFAKEGRYLLSRDYMTLKLWDINMDSGPVVTFQVHEHLKPKLCDLYENDSIFDKFECCISGDGLRAATSSYSNLFRVFGVSPGSTETATLGASRNPMSLNLSGKKDEIGKHETRQETYDGT
ncbi:hypothetical protein BRARA_F02784 [Brassica rapa]|uniref:Serine/threonine-protein phosphatase 2A 55 kDa regulatory subunit B n=1 Tax=Brassica campestris TaxID=3711 RepID=A0A397ZBE6_BRACM|nr:hypothetical protein BRARA_F02784 [Brassica rapa]